MKKLRVLPLFLFLFPLVLANVSFAATSYSDVPSNHWAKGSIEYMSEQGHITGYPEGTFRPNSNITRAEFTAILVRLLDINESPNPFFDKTSAKWANDLIGGAVNAGILVRSDYGNGDYLNPNTPITRIEMAKMMARALAHENQGFAESLSTLNGDVILPFTDFHEMKKNDLPYIALISGTGVMNGTPDDAFGLTRNATRAEAASTLHRLIQKKDTDASTHYALQSYEELAVNRHNINLFLEDRTFKNLNEIIDQLTDINLSNYIVSVNHMIAFDPKILKTHLLRCSINIKPIRDILFEENHIHIALNLDVERKEVSYGWYPYIDSFMFGYPIFTPFSETLGNKFNYNALDITNLDGRNGYKKEVMKLNNVYRFVVAKKYRGNSNRDYFAYGYVPNEVKIQLLDKFK